MIASTITPMLDNLTVPEDEAAVDAWMDSLLKVDSPHVVSFVNAHAVNLMFRDDGLEGAMVSSDTLFRDGSGMKIMMKLIGREPGANLNGTDLIPRIIDKFAADGRKIAVFGTQEPWLEKGVEAIRARGGEVVCAMDGFKDANLYLAAAQEHKPDLLILAMGMPRQEKVAMQLRTALTQPIVMVNGGAVIDFLGGKVERAPVWMRDMGIEWVYRLLREPRRMFSRYVIGNVTFLAKAVWLKLTYRPG